MLYISLHHVYEELEKRGVKMRYDELIKYVESLAETSLRVRLQIHPRYVSEIDKGYRIYIVPD